MKEGHSLQPEITEVSETQKAMLRVRAIEMAREIFPKNAPAMLATAEEIYNWILNGTYDRNRIESLETPQTSRLRPVN